MTYEQATRLRTKINSFYPDLHPEVHMLGNGEFIVRLMTSGYRGDNKARYHIWDSLSWDSYRYFVLEGRRQEVPA